MIKNGGNGFDFDLETEVQFPRRNDRPGRAVITGLGVMMSRAARRSSSPVAPTVDIVRATGRVRSVFLSILGISWFWFLGAAFLALLPNYSKDVLGGDTPVLTLGLLALVIVVIAALVRGTAWRGADVSACN